MTSTRLLIHAALLALLAATVVAGSPRAQTGDIADLKQAIERNEELLLEARALVLETNSAKARTSLEAAVKLHELSKDLVSSNQNVLAARTVVRARQAILNTINIAKREARLEEQALRAMERATIRLGRARTAYEEHGSRDDAVVRKLIEEARNQLQRARNNIQEHLFGVALQLANASTDLSNRALMMLKRDAIGPEAVLRELERTDRILERATALGGLEGHPMAARSIDQALELQNRARQNARSENFRLALEQSRRARDIALRVIRTARGRGVGGREAAARAVAFTDELLAQAVEVARENDAKRVLDKLDRALEIQRDARQRLGDGDYERAMKLTLRARDAAKRALRALERPLDEEAVRAALEQTDRLAAELRERLAGADNELARSLLERSRERQADAWKAFEGGDLRRALALTKVARSLARRGLAELGNEHS